MISMCSMQVILIVVSVFGVTNSNLERYETSINVNPVGVSFKLHFKDTHPRKNNSLFRRQVPIYNPVPTSKNLKEKKLANITKAMGDVGNLLDVHLVGASAAAVVTGFELQKLEYVNPSRAAFYANAYRGLLSFLVSLYNSCVDQKPYAAHKYFLKENRRRKMTNEVPEAVRKLFPWISRLEWDKEETTMRLIESTLKTYWTHERWFVRHLHPSMKTWFGKGMK